jgi:LemA protein
MLQHVVIVILFLLIASTILLYNGLVAKKNQVANALAGTDALLKKRYDLLPNLIAIVKTYMQYEQKILIDITEMRTRAVSGQLSDDEKVELENRFSKIMGGVMVAVENYPDLKANQNFLQLQASFNEIEEQISAARRAYNAAVTDFNNACEMFPTNIMASKMHYNKQMLFEVSDNERSSVNPTL